MAGKIITIPVDLTDESALKKVLQTIVDEVSLMKDVSSIQLVSSDAPTNEELGKKVNMIIEALKDARILN